LLINYSKLNNRDNMKKLTLFVAALVMAGSAFACDGSKDCCKKGQKGGKACCKKEAAASAAHCEKKGCDKTAAAHKEEAKQSVTASSSTTSPAPAKAK
jgi:hypothetical protein